MLTTVEAGRDIDAYKDEVPGDSFLSCIVQACSEVLVNQQCRSDAADVWGPLLQVKDVNVSVLTL